MNSIFQVDALRRSALYACVTGVLHFGGLAGLVIGAGKVFDSFLEVPGSTSEAFMLGLGLQILFFLFFRIYLDEGEQIAQLDFIIGIAGLFFGWAFWYTYGFVVLLAVLALLLVVIVGWAIYRDFFNKRTRLLAAKPEANEEAQQT